MKLEELKGKELEIIIKADTNDADYVKEVTVITWEELESVLPIIEAIKNFQPYRSGNYTHSHNYPNGENMPRRDLGEKTPEEIYSGFTEEQWENFNNIVPFGIHSIYSIEVSECSPKITLL